MALAPNNLDENAVGGIEKDPIVQEAIKRFKITSKYHSKAYKWSDEDNRFSAGNDQNGYQWSYNDRKDRKDVGLNCLTVNVIPKFLSDIEGEIRMNRARIKFLPTGGRSSKQVADIYEGIGRKIERDSNAESIYDFVGNRMLVMGMGYAYVDIDYECQTSFHKRIIIKPIKDSCTVYPDPRPYDLDTEKMRYCFVTRWIPKDDYKELYGTEREGVEWTGDTLTNQTDWYRDKSIRIAYYYRLVSTKVTMVQLSTGAIMEKEKALAEIARLELALNVAASTNPMASQLTVSGLLKAPEIREEKEMDVDHVELYIIDGSRVLEGPFDIPGNMIPIAGCYGRMDVIDGVTYFKGIVRDLKVEQVKLNYWVSTEVDQMSTKSRAQYFMTQTQLRGLSEFYMKSNKVTTFALPYNFELEPGTQQVAPPPIPIPPADISPNILQAVDNCISQMKSITGFGEPLQLKEGEGNQSGKALIVRQKSIDKGLFCWIDNHTKFIGRVGRIIRGMIPEVYCEQRMERILGLDGSEQDVQINSVERDPLLDIEYHINDLSAGDYDVQVDTGPSYTTKRMEMKEDIKEFMSLYPSQGFLLSDIYARNSDWPENEEIAERMGFIIDQQAPGMRKPDPKKPQRQAPPTPQQQVMMSESQSRVAVAQAKGQEATSKAELAKMKVAEEASKLGLDADKLKTLILSVFQEVLAGASPRQPAQPAQPTQQAVQPPITQAVPQPI